MITLTMNDYNNDDSDNNDDDNADDVDLVIEAPGPALPRRVEVQEEAEAGITYKDLDDDNT